MTFHPRLRLIRPSRRPHPLCQYLVSPQQSRTYPRHRIRVATHDFNGFAGLRVVIRQKPKDGSYGSGSRGTSFFWIGYRPGEERGRTVFRFPAEPTREIRMNHVSAVVPPERPFEVNYADADGKVVTFEIEPRFLADVVRRADIVPLKLERFPPPLGSLYFEGLATALVIAVVGQTDARLPAAGNLYVQNERIQKALAYIEAHFRSKLTRPQMAAAAHLSDFHFSRLFSRLIGLSPEAYLLDCRLRYAQKLLALHGSECSLAEVAADAGFVDQSHFGRQFRRALGQTPHEYRRHK